MRRMLTIVALIGGLAMPSTALANREDASALLDATTPIVSPISGYLIALSTRAEPNPYAKPQRDGSIEYTVQFVPDSLQEWHDLGADEKAQYLQSLVEAMEQAEPVGLRWTAEVNIVDIEYDQARQASTGRNAGLPISTRIH